jgi:putative lipoprotein
MTQARRGRTGPIGACWALAALLLAGCASVDEAPVPPSATVTGTVTYRLRIALPAEAVVRVSLTEISGTDAPAILVARTTIPTHGRQPPIAFSLPYDPARLDPRARYAVDARIEVEGRLLFIATQRYPVITGGHPARDIEIAVEPPGSSRAPL